MFLYYLWGLDTQSAVLYRKYIKRGRGEREAGDGGRDALREGGMWCEREGRQKAAGVC